MLRKRIATCVGALAMALLVFAVPVAAQAQTCQAIRPVTVCFGNVGQQQFCVAGWGNTGSMGTWWTVQSSTNPDRMTAYVYACLLYIPTDSWVGGCPYQQYVGGTTYQGSSLPNGDPNPDDYWAYGLWYNTSLQLVGQAYTHPQFSYC